MEIYGILFQIAVVIFIAYFIFWILSVMLPKRGLEQIFIFFSYPMILIVIVASIMALLDENLKLIIKFTFMGIAVVWLIAGLTLEYEPKNKKQLFLRLVLQFFSLIGAWILIENFYLF